MTYLATADFEGSFLSGGFPPWVVDELHSAATKNPPNPLDVFKACGFMSSAMVEAAFRTSSVNNWFFNHWYSASGVLLIMAILLRMLAFLAMRYLHQKRYA